MGVRINSGDSLGSLNQLNQISKKLNKSSKKLSTGKQITEAYEDVIGLLRAASLTSSINEAAQHQNLNTQRQSDLASSQTHLFQNLDRLQNMRNLAVQAADDTVDSSTRQTLVNQANENLTSYGSGAPALDLSSSIEAKNSITHLDSAIENVVSQLASQASDSQTLESDTQASQTHQENLMQARSVIEDTDFAVELSNNKMLQIQQTLLLRVLQHKDEQKKSVLSLVT